MVRLACDRPTTSVGGGAMARQIVYLFNGNVSTQEIATDADDSVKIPASGTRYLHHGKWWFVAKVENCQMIDVQGPIRTVRIFLTD
jgi:hypothetical protein